MVAAAGCGGVPSSGAVHLGRQVAMGGSAEDVDVRVLPPPPHGGESPSQIVHGFLVASVNNEDDARIAREYLTPNAAARWDPDANVTLYDEKSLSIDVGHDSVAVVTANRVGSVSPDGDYLPDPGRLSVSLHLQRVSGEWRVADPPTGRLLMTVDATRSFRAQNVFFLDPGRRVVVPDLVLLQVPQNGLPTALIRALVAGPSPWLRPAVVSAVPSRTRLIGNVPVNGGVADVNLSRQVLNADPASRMALSAQIVATLQQIPSVDAVRIFADGVPLSVPGAEQRQPSDAWQQYNSDMVGADHRLRYVDRGALRTDGRDVPLHGVRSLSRPAISSGGDLIAAVVPTGTGEAVYSGSADGPLRPRVSGLAVTTPSFDPSDVAWTVVTAPSGRQRVARLLPSGAVAPVEASELLALGTVHQLRISRDGTRVAAVVGEGASARLLVGRVVVPAHGTASVGGFRDVLPDWSDVSDVEWSDAEHLVALARSDAVGARPHRVPVQTDVDGFIVTPLPVSGLPPDVSQITAAPDRPVVVAGNGHMWIATLGRWQDLGAGTDPAYPC